MNDAIKMQVSAFVDGELPDNEAELLLRRMSQDAELREQAADYMAIGRAIRGERLVAGIDQLRGRISAALDDQSLALDMGPIAKSEKRYVRPLAGVAIAATVALVAILGLQQISDPQATSEAIAGADGTVTDAAGAGYVVPDPAEDRLREYYLRHATGSSEIGVSSINTRLVTLELSDGTLVEIEPQDALAEEPEAAGGADIDATP